MHRLFLIFLSLCTYALASLLAIDYGGEWIKASLIKPGVPFDVLLNRDSKRKIQSSIAWKEEDRLFGGDAFSITSRFPSDSFNGLKILQGRPFKDDSVVEFYTQVFQNDLIETSRGSVAFQRPPSTSKSSTVTQKDSDRQWTTEELIAMQLSYIKDLADSVSGKTADRVRDVVMTVPPFYTQQERRAVADAIEIAGLKLLALVNDGTAVAVNYAMTRTFNDKEWHVIYDAGATSITATVVSFSSITPSAESSSKKGNATEITVAATAFDRTAGGIELDRRLRDILVKDFNDKNRALNLDITGDKRGMAKMWKEAGRAKSILSANTEAGAHVESVAFDIDFRSKLTRQQFEAACSDLEPRFAKPILDAISKAGLTLGDINSVILTGGASRTPMIQNAVRKAVGESKIATNVNADESAVLGAALYGASLSRQFKTREIKVNDVGVWDVVIGYPAASDSKRMINTLVFPGGSKTASKKTLTLKRTEDFIVKLAYRDEELASTPGIASVEITGVAEAITNMTERVTSSGGADTPVLKLTVITDRDGFVSVADAIVWGDVKEEGFAAKLKGFFSGGNKTSEGDLAMESDTDTAGSNSSTLAFDDKASSEFTESTSSSTTGASSDASSKTTSTKPSATPTASAKERSTIHLDIQTIHLGIRPLTPFEKRKSRDRLISLDTSESLKRRKDEARNNLEGHLYRLRDLLESEPTTPFMECSAEEERRRLEATLGEILSWMYANGDEANTGELWEKRDLLEQMEKPIKTRYTEREAFPEALSDLQQAHWATRMFLQSAVDNATEETEAGLPHKYTPEELRDVENKLVESEAWLNDGVEKQKAIKRCGDADPVLLSAEMKARGSALQRDVMRLLKRKAPWKKPTPSSSSSTLSTSSRSTSTETSTAESKHTKDEL